MTFDFDREFKDGFDRHVRSLGYVPPEFQNEQRFTLPDIPEFNFPRDTSNAAMRRLMPITVWAEIENAGELSHRTRSGRSSTAEYARERAGYGGLSPERTIRIPDQRPLIQGGDHNPLD